MYTLESGELRLGEAEEKGDTKGIRTAVVKYQFMLFWKICILNDNCRLLQTENKFYFKDKTFKDISLIQSADQDSLLYSLVLKN